MLKAFYEDIKLGFEDYGIRFLPKLLVFPFVFSIFVIGMLLHDLHYKL